MVKVLFRRPCHVPPYLINGEGGSNNIVRRLTSILWLYVSTRRSSTLPWECIVFHSARSTYVVSVGYSSGKRRRDASDEGGGGVRFLSPTHLCSRGNGPRRRPASHEVAGGEGASSLVGQVPPAPRALCCCQTVVLSFPVTSWRFFVPCPDRDGDALDHLDG